MESTAREAKIKIVDGIRKPDNATKKAMTMKIWVITRKEQH